jgi:hypothetical protein
VPDDYFPYDEGESFRPSRSRAGLWGYVNEDREFVIPPFGAAGGFHSGLAAVAVQDRWGFINEAGQFVVAPQFHAAKVEPRFKIASDFFEGKSYVREEHGKGVYVSSAGRVPVELSFKQTVLFLSAAGKTVYLPPVVG